MATRKEQYTAALNEVIRRFDRMEDATVRAMVDLLRSFRREVIATLATLPGPQEDTFNAFRLSELRDEIDAMVVTLEGQLINTTATAVREGGELGLASVTQPLTAAGVTTFYNRPSMAQVNTIVDFSAELIRGITADTLRQINAQISRVALGGISPFQAQRNVTSILGVTTRGAGKQVVGGIGYNAERIIRTETNRAHNVSAFAQMQEVGKITPDAMKRWNATGDHRTRDAHMAAHGQLKPIDKPFNVGGEQLMYPLDPSASGKNTIHCRCRMTTVHPDIGVIGGPLDGRIAKERKRREEMA